MLQGEGEGEGEGELSSPSLSSCCVNGDERGKQDGYSELTQHYPASALSSGNKKKIQKQIRC